MAKPPLRLLFEAQAKELGNLEKQQQAAALKLYGEARADLLQRLEFLGEDSKLTARMFQRASLAVVASLNDYGHEFRLELGRMVKPAATLARDHLRQQFKLWAERMPALSASNAIDKASPLLEPQFSARVDAHASKLTGDLRQRLALSLQAGESGSEARKRLVTGYLGPLPESIAAAVRRAADASVRTALDEGDKPNMAAFGKQVPLKIASGLTEWARDIPTPAYWAQKVVTDAVVRASGSAAVVLIDQARSEMPGLQKRWVSVIDERTSDICEALDGELVDIDDTFDADGEDVMSPPAHPNCRATIAAWDPTGAIAFDEVKAHAR